jgi:prepilin-type N-terminal cleavage/methylation domain-containing protein
MDRIRRAPRQNGFGLAEVCVVLLVLGILSAIAIPNYYRAQRKSRVGRTAAEMRNIGEAFLSYKLTTGFFPLDSFHFPPEMDGYLDPALWDATPIGGTYNWEGPNNFAYAGVSIQPADAAPVEEYQMIDAILDDGNLATGRFIIGTNGRATLLIDDSGEM